MEAVGSKVCIFLYFLKLRIGRTTKLKGKHNFRKQRKDVEDHGQENNRAEKGHERGPLLNVHLNCRNRTMLNQRYSR
ncbi:hypothetical protein POVCU2_0015960 [Plasmodium ovale curtisi]|uniref:Uncharacterized protein n=1 Tax=Plasmodium ovale curtisi TaxID=864141 RepID=A0A1A8W6C2_PLAOA|nr:hypothetical protein POVCU2_0015960 [Plasmodium ovale curtisi]SBS87226.1 hypothetical protein POVCU1_014240 [Plasmodium ovale curtisi]